MPVALCALHTGGCMAVSLPGRPEAGLMLLRSCPAAASGVQPGYVAAKLSRDFSTLPCRLRAAYTTRRGFNFWNIQDSEISVYLAYSLQWCATHISQLSFTLITVIMHHSYSLGAMIKFTKSILLEFDTLLGALGQIDSLPYLLFTKSDRHDKISSE